MYIMCVTAALYSFYESSLFFIFNDGSICFSSSGVLNNRCARDLVRFEQIK